MRIDRLIDTGPWTSGCGRRRRYAEMQGSTLLHRQVAEALRSTAIQAGDPCNVFKSGVIYVDGGNASVAS